MLRKLKAMGCAPGAVNGKGGGEWQKGPRRQLVQVCCGEARCEDQQWSQETGRATNLKRGGKRRQERHEGRHVLVAQVRSGEGYDAKVSGDCRNHGELLTSMGGGEAEAREGLEDRFVWVRGVHCGEGNKVEISNDNNKSEKVRTTREGECNGKRGLRKKK